MGTYRCNGRWTQGPVNLFGVLRTCQGRNLAVAPRTLGAPFVESHRGAAIWHRYRVRALCAQELSSQVSRTRRSGIPGANPHFQRRTSFFRKLYFSLYFRLLFCILSVAQLPAERGSSVAIPPGIEGMKECEDDARTDPDPRPFSGYRTVEIGWTAIRRMANVWHRRASLG